MRNLQCDRRGIDQFLMVDACQRTTRYVAHHVAASALRREADCVQRIHHFGQRLNRQPVQLNILTNGNVGQVARILPRDPADRSQLARRDDSVRDADAHHEIVRNKSLTTLAAGGAHAVSLRVDSPPFEVRASPLRDDAGASLACKGPHLVKCFPGILGDASGVRHAGPWSLSGERQLQSYDLFEGNLKCAENRKPATAKAASRAIRKPLERWKL